MNIPRFTRILFPLLLLVLVAPNAAANTIEDSAERTWRSNSVEVDGSKQVRIDITDAAGPMNSFYATSSPGDSIDPFLYCFQDQVWLVWSRERTTIPGTYDIYQRRLYASGALGPLVQVTKVAGMVDYSDRKPAAAACPLGHHIAFQRETTTEFGTRCVITYMNNIWGDGSIDGTWINAVPEEIELPSGRSGTEVTLLLGNNDDGSPTVAAFKEWVAQYHISGLKSRQANISIWNRELDIPSDPNPWERMITKLPDNP